MKALHLKHIQAGGKLSNPRYSVREADLLVPALNLTGLHIYFPQVSGIGRLLSLSLNRSQMVSSHLGVLNSPPHDSRAPSLPHLTILGWLFTDQLHKYARAIEFGLYLFISLFNVSTQYVYILFVITSTSNKMAVSPLEIVIQATKS